VPFYEKGMEKNLRPFHVYRPFKTAKLRLFPYLRRDGVRRLAILPVSSGEMEVRLIPISQDKMVSPTRQEADNTRHFKAKEGGGETLYGDV